MKNASNRVLALSMSAGVLLAVVGLGVQSGGFTANVQAAPAYSSPEPSPPPPPPPPAVTQAPSYDNSYGQGDGGGGGGGGGG
jgi:hypothetical protein